MQHWEAAGRYPEVARGTHATGLMSKIAGSSEQPQSMFELRLTSLEIREEFTYPSPITLRRWFPLRVVKSNAFKKTKEELPKHGLNVIRAVLSSRFTCGIPKNGLSEMRS